MSDQQYFPGIPAHVPVYQLLADHYMDDDTLHVTGEQVAYEGPPSEHMAPLNEAARVRMQEMLDHLESEARKQAALVGRAYTGRLTDLGDLIAQVKADTEVLVERKRALPVVPQTEVPIRPDMVPMAVRRQKAKQTAVRAFGQATVKGRAVAEPIHKPDQGRLTDKAPLEG